jgi:hypothetical protein
MKLVSRLTILFLLNLSVAFAQTAPAQPESLGDAARELKNDNKGQSTTHFSDDSQLMQKPLIPDVASGDHDNLDEILKGIDDFRGAHNLQETETAVHDWYNQQVALLTNAIAENHRILHHERDKSKGCAASDVRPNNHDEYVNLRRTEKASREEDRRQMKINQLLIDRIQQDFRMVRPQMRNRYEMHTDWFILCPDETCNN